MADNCKFALLSLGRVLPPHRLTPDFKDEKRWLGTTNVQSVRPLLQDHSMLRDICDLVSSHYIRENGGVESLPTPLSTL